MTMNAKSIGLAVATVTSVVPAALILGSARHAHKTLGAPGSLSHVLTNDKLDNKGKVLVEQTKENNKNLLKLGGITVCAGAAASLATGCSKTLTNLLHQLKHWAGEKLSQVSISKIPSNVKVDRIIFNEAEFIKEQLNTNKNLKDMIKNTKLFQKLNSLPTPAKAGLAVSAAILALAAPITALISSQKAGYIEGKHENK